MMKKLIGLLYLFILTSQILLAQQNNTKTTPRQELLENAADETPQNLMLQGNDLVKLRKYPDALVLYGKAAAQFNQKKDYTAYGNAVLKMSDVHYFMRNYTAAEQSILNVALKAFGKASDKNGMMRCYQALGNIYIGLKKPVEALWFFAQQGNVAEQINDQISITESLLNVATVKIIRKQYALASKDLEVLTARVAQLKQDQKYNVLISKMKSIVSARMPSKRR